MTGVAGANEEENMGEVLMAPAKKVVPQKVDRLSKANTYETSDGLSFWYDYEQRKIVTANPSIFLGIVRVGERNSEKQLYLSIDNVKIQFAGPNGDALPAFQERDNDGVTIWEFGSIGVPFYYDTLSDDLKHERKRPASERYVPLAIDEKFNSLEQQSKAISYVQDFLSRYNDNWIGASRGDEQSARVVFTDELQQLILAGSYVE